MPFIDSKITVPVSPEKKEVLKTELGQALSLLHKPESYLMVGMEDNYDLWMAGKKLEKGAYVSVSLFGNASNLPGRGGRKVFVTGYKICQKFYGFN